MIQDIAPHQYNITYQTPYPKAGDNVLAFQNGGVLCKINDNNIFFPSVEEVSEKFLPIYKQARFFFDIDGQSYFGLPDAQIDRFGDWDYLPVGKLRRIKPMWKAYAGITGYQIYQFYTQNRFCGCCGEKMQIHETERAMRCPGCGRLRYPQICPSVIVGIISGSRILLTKYAPGHSSFRKYALVAGYAEVGESLEDTVRREVMEEVGLQVTNIRYYKSQPWSFSGALLAGFFCEAKENAAITMDPDELSAAEWFRREELPEERSEADISLTGEMIEAFRKGLVL